MCSAVRRVSSEGWKLSRRGERWPWPLAEEADESLDVLGSRSQEELLANKLHPAQPQAAESDPILEFREQRLRLLSFPLCVHEAWRVDQVSCALPGRLMHVDSKILQRCAGAFRFL